MCGHVGKMVGMLTVVCKWGPWYGVSSTLGSGVGRTLRLFGIEKALRLLSIEKGFRVQIQETPLIQFNSRLDHLILWWIATQSLADVAALRKWSL